MSVFSASGILTPAQAAEYSDALLHLLGNQNPMEVMGESPLALRRELDHLPAQLHGTHEAPGKWSARMVLAHLADSELVASFRLRMLLAQERPALQPYDQDLWASRLHYDIAEVGDSLERFTVLRRANLMLWSAASISDLARTGVHGERGEESVERLRRLHAGHDLVHRHQLSRIRILLAGQ